MNTQVTTNKLKQAIEEIEKLQGRHDEILESLIKDLQVDRPQVDRPLPFEGVSGNAAKSGSRIGDEKEPEEPETPIISMQNADDEFSWITELRRWEGIPETDEKIKELLGAGYDWSVTSWCAHGLNKVLELCGWRGTGSMLAASFADWGEEGDGSYGDIAVYDKHVTVVVERGKGLGCNQGNTIKESNLAWFNENMTFLGFRRVPQVTA